KPWNSQLQRQDSQLHRHFSDRTGCMSITYYPNRRVLPQGNNLKGQTAPTDQTYLSLKPFPERRRKKATWHPSRLKRAARTILLVMPLNSSSRRSSVRAPTGRAPYLALLAASRSSRLASQWQIRKCSSADFKLAGSSASCLSTQSFMWPCGFFPLPPRP